MIKGVNRQIIEVTDTGNEYFERALLIVRPRFSDMPYGRLYDEQKVRQECRSVHQSETQQKAEEKADGFIRHVVRRAGRSNRRFGDAVVQVIHGFP